MTRVWVEISGENSDLARAEVRAAAAALGGGAGDDADRPDHLVGVELPPEGGAEGLAVRLALARRVLAPRAAGAEIEPWLRRAGAEGGTASVRRLGRPSSGGEDPHVLAAGRTFSDAGGRIDLGAPRRRFWLTGADPGPLELLEEIATVDRPAANARRMPVLPFQRPVSLPPRLARAAANLAEIRPGDRVVDPFVGTGALLAEAGLLGARLYGLDRDPEMVRGTLRNLGHLGLTADELVVGDAGTAEFGDPGLPFDAVLTDPPYGRASSTGGEDPTAIVDRVLPRWAERVRPGGRVVVIVPGPIAGPGPAWRLTLAVPLRVHRSLTREFRVYARAGPTPRLE